MRLDPIVMSPYDPMEHIGSTAIPGMPAKAIIDMVAVIGVIEDVLDAIDALSELGWLQAPEPPDDEHRRRSFCTPSIVNQTHHLHVVEKASDHWPGLLAFRDYLAC